MIKRLSIVATTVVVSAIMGFCLWGPGAGERSGSAEKKSVHLPVKIYYKPACPYCTAAKKLFQQRGIHFEAIDINESSGLRHEMARLSKGNKTVPQIFIGERHIGGYDALRELAFSGSLDRLLGWHLPASEADPEPGNR